MSWPTVPRRKIKRINTAELGTPPGYSQIVDVSASHLVFIAGQTATDRDGNVVGKNDFPTQAEQVFRNLTTALTAAGCTAANLIKLTVFLRDINNLAAYPAGPRPVLRDRNADRRTGRDFDRSVAALRRGLFDRDRSDRRNLRPTARFKKRLSANQPVAAADKSRF
jgi:enamine deaminase RidA (YjgF/YER057c/UK114 family)